ncbi:MAG: hypothetical protein ABI664_17025 [bacterium]
MSACVGVKLTAFIDRRIYTQWQRDPVVVRYGEWWGGDKGCVLPELLEYDLSSSYSSDHRVTAKVQTGSQYGRPFFIVAKPY